jgi:GT2 family glycosyltransferase
MVRHLQHNSNIGAVGPLTNNIGNEAKLFVEYDDMQQMKESARQVTTGYRGVFTRVNVLAYFAVMFRRADLETFGLLSEDYGKGMFEDDDHCATIRSKGYICGLAEDAFVHHQLSATFNELKNGEKEILFEKNKKIFERKWGKWIPHQYREQRPPNSFSKRDQ